MLAVRPFLKALSDAAVCNPSSISHVGWRSPTAEVHLPQIQTPRDVLCWETLCCALISFVWHQIFPAHFDSPVILFPWCQGGWIILLALGHTRVSARIISPSVFKSRTAFPTLTSMDRAYTTVIIKGIFLPKKEISNKDWKIHIIRSRNHFKGWQLLLKMRGLSWAPNCFISAWKSLFQILYFQ